MPPPRMSQQHSPTPNVIPRPLTRKSVLSDGEPGSSTPPYPGLLGNDTSTGVPPPIASNGSDPISSSQYTSSSGGGSTSGIEGSLPPSSNDPSSSSEMGIATSTSITGSGPGSVNGSPDSRNALSPAGITAILLAALLVLSILVVAARLLWRRHREHQENATGVANMPTRESSDASNYMRQSPNMNAATNFAWDPRIAKRLRGGLNMQTQGSISPSGQSTTTSTSHGSSGNSLPSEYRIEPFALPLPAHTTASRWLTHGRSESTTRLLDDAEGAGLEHEAPRPSAPFRPEKRPLLSSRPSHARAPQAPPRGAMRLPIHGANFAFLPPSVNPSANPTHLSESDMVFELPPTYASLQQPRPVRRWFQFWPQNTSQQDGGDRD